MNSVNILGVNFVNDSYNNFIRTLENRINTNQNTFIVTANPEIVMYAHKHPNFRNLINHATYVTPDGIGIVKASNTLSQHPIPQRITGYDIFKSLLAWGNQNHKTAYFIGAKPQVIQRLNNVLAKTYPNLQIEGLHDGYFKDAKSLMLNIKGRQPDMIFIAMGYPKQEELINKYRKIDNGLWIGLGGSFDVLSGSVKRAPKFWINHHLEWLYRLITEPTRFKRMFAIPKFMMAVSKQAHHTTN